MQARWGRVRVRKRRRQGQGFVRSETTLPPDYFTSRLHQPLEVLLGRASLEGIGSSRVGRSSHRADTVSANRTGRSEHRSSSDPPFVRFTSTAFRHASNLAGRCLPEEDPVDRNLEGWKGMARCIGAEKGRRGTNYVHALVATDRREGDEAGQHIYRYERRAC